MVILIFIDCYCTCTCIAYFLPAVEVVFQRLLVGQDALAGFEGYPVAVPHLSVTAAAELPSGVCLGQQMLCPPCQAAFHGAAAAVVSVGREVFLGWGEMAKGYDLDVLAAHVA